MIQSDKFDSFSMDIKKITNSTLTFLFKRLLEISGIIVLLMGILLLTALISYSPNDPNFIFPQNSEIKNLLGFRGSYVSDLFFQCIGLISYLVPFTLIFTGLSIFKRKEFFLIIENLFFAIPYCLLGSLFFDFFYQNTFSLYINGNGGFVGSYLNQSIFNDLIKSYENISFYLISILIIFFFLISINFNYKNFYLYI